MTNWTLLRDAYGSAAAVEELLERAEAGERAVWDELWSRLCHQGTVYAASYAVLPQLAELAARVDPSAGAEALFLATCIVASTDGPVSPAAVRARYAGSIRVLNEAAERLLAYASDDTDFVYRLQALMVTESDTAWATYLDALANKELEFACPGCDEQLVVGFEPSHASVAQFDDSVVETTVVPSAPGRLADSEARAYELASTHRRPEVAQQLLDLFGLFECPACGFTGPTTSALS